MKFTTEKKFDLDINKINDPIVLIGWPGIALVSKLAIDSIKDSINADLFLNIEFFDFPAKSVVETGVLEIPAAKVYYKSRELENDLFILTADFQPQSPNGVFEFAEKFCEEMDKITGGKIKTYVSAGALIAESITKEPMVHVCSTDKELMRSFLELENTKMMKSGIIAGANGILPAWAGAKGYAPGVCLLAETIPLPMMTLDPRASKALVMILKEYFKIDMNFDELDKKIEEMQSIFDSLKRQADSFMKGPPEDKGTDSYFR